MQNVIDLILATLEDAELVHKLHIKAFMPLYEKYHDDETSPARETLETVTRKITEPNSEFYIICLKGEVVGGRIRIRHHQDKIILNNINWISPIFVIPSFQNRGIVQKVIQRVFKLYPDTITWKLATIKQETGNCHLYEKCGFVKVGTEQMTLINYEYQA